MNYVDVHTQPVVGAGRATAGMSGDWSSWASSAASDMRNAASGANDSVVGPALEGFLGSINPSLQAMAPNTDALGTNAVSASHTICNADGEAATGLNRAGKTADGSSGHLRRPIVQ